jgi:hypothetical protein
METTHCFFILCHKSSPSKQSKKDALAKQVFELFLWNIYKMDVSDEKCGRNNQNFKNQGATIKNGEFKLPDEKELLESGKKWCLNCIQIKEIKTDFNKMGTNKICIACVSKVRNNEMRWIHKNQEATSNGEKACSHCSHSKTIEKEFIDEQGIKHETCHYLCRANNQIIHKARTMEIQLEKKQKWKKQGTAFVQDISLSLFLFYKTEFPTHFLF